jgi:transposase
MILPKLGVDQSKNWFDVCLLCGNKPRKKKFSNDESGFRALREWLSKQGISKVHMCMEATGRYGNKLATFMHEGGHTVSVVNPRWVSDHRDAMGKRNKTDPGDAFVNADYARCHEPGVWLPKDSMHLELCDLFGEMLLVKKALVAFKNRGKCGLESTYVKEVNATVIAQLEEQLEALKTQANKVLSSDAQSVLNIQIFQSVPGIGEEIAFGLVAKVDFSQFLNGRQLAAFLGTSSKEWQSGLTKHRGKQSKEGSDQLRTLLRMGAMSATYTCPLYIEFAERLRKRGLQERQIINAVARKMLLIAHALIRKQQLFDACYVHPLSKAA